MWYLIVNTTNIHMLITIAQWNGTNSHTHIHNAHSGAFTRCVGLIRSIASSENISDGRKPVSELETTSDEWWTWMIRQKGPIDGIQHRTTAFIYVLWMPVAIYAFIHTCTTTCYWSHLVSQSIFTDICKCIQTSVPLRSFLKIQICSHVLGFIVIWFLLQSRWKLL